MIVGPTPDLRRQAMARNMRQTSGTVRMSRGSSNLVKAIAEVGHGLSRGLTSLGEQRVGAVGSHSHASAQLAPSPSDLFVQALQDNSNLEMDWLWLFTQVSSM